MKFFIPFAEGEEETASVYSGIKRFAAETTGWTVKDRKIARLQYRHDGKTYEAVVGENEQRTGEPIIAILESSVTYLVCTPNRGVVRGTPILVGHEEKIAVTEFDEGP